MTFNSLGLPTELLRAISDQGCIKPIPVQRHLVCGNGCMAKVVTREECVNVDAIVELRNRCKIRRGQTVEFEGNSIELE